MHPTLNLRNTIDDRVVFLREFLRHPRQIASITPSSRFLVRRIVDVAAVRSARTVVKLGAGTGGTTRAILAAMAPDARLLIVEINPHFCALLGRAQVEMAPFNIPPMRLYRWAKRANGEQVLA